MNCLPSFARQFTDFSCPQEVSDTTIHHIITISYAMLIAPQPKRIETRLICGLLTHALVRYQIPNSPAVFIYGV
jgi:hypothetical protein